MKIRVLDRIETSGHSKENIDSLVKEARSTLSYPCFLKKSKSVARFPKLIGTSMLRNRDPIGTQLFMK